MTKLFIIGASLLKVVKKRKMTSENIVDNIKKSRRLTSDILMSNEVHSLYDLRFLAAYHEHHDTDTARIEEMKSK